jgi:hypothetical protein
MINSLNSLANSNASFPAAVHDSNAIGNSSNPLANVYNAYITFSAVPVYNNLTAS